jgi:predicted transcriptional regulator
MTRAERIAQAYGLRYAGGWTQQRIADELGVTSQTVSRYLNPERTRRQARENNRKRRQAAREWADKNARGTCESCGGQLHEGSKYDGTRQCITCFRGLNVVKAGDERTAQIVRDRVEMDKAIYEAWHRGLADGSSPKEVAFSLGITQAALMEHVSLMRRAGHDLPSRHQVAA